MLKLSSPGKAFLILFFITIAVFQYGLQDTALTLLIFIGGLILYNWWVRSYYV